MTATVAVLGPGGVGGTLAVRLALAGNRVACVARPSTAAAIARDGLTLECEGETLLTRPQAVERLEEPVDLLLVTVKAYVLDDALARVVPGAGGVGLVLPLLNGLEHMETIRARMGVRVATGSIGHLEAYRPSPTRIVQTTPTPMVTAAAGEPLQDELASALAVLRTAGVEVRSAVSERAVLWDKAVRLAPLAAVTSLTQRPLGDLRRDRDWGERLRTAVEEACAAAAADGVDVSPAAQWEMIGAMPATLTTSAARDVAAGRPSEIDAIVGAVVRAGRRLNVPTPTLDDLLSQLEAA